MAYTVDNIIQGAAALYFGPVGSPLPTFTAGQPASETQFVTAGWKHIGFTSEGVEVEYSPEYTDVEVDQLLDAALLFKTKQSVSVKTTLTEATLENLLFVWGLKATALKSSGNAWDGDTLAAGESELGLDGGSLNEFPHERSLSFVGPGPRTNSLVTKERVYLLRRVLQTDASTHGLKKAEATTLPVSFRCLPDPSKTGSGYGVIRDRKIA